MSHTPGPWKRGNMTNRPNKIYVDGFTICLVEGISNGGRWSNGDTQGPKMHAIGKANARLIATAPDLLEALDQAYTKIIELLNEGDFKRKMVFDATYIVKTLEKARGKS